MCRQLAVRCLTGVSIVCDISLITRIYSDRHLVIIIIICSHKSWRVRCTQIWVNESNLSGNQSAISRVYCITGPLIVYWRHYYGCVWCMSRWYVMVCIQLIRWHLNVIVTKVGIRSYISIWIRIQFLFTINMANILLDSNKSFNPLNYQFSKYFNKKSKLRYEWL